MARYHAPCLVADPPHQADERRVLVVAQIVGADGPVKNGSFDQSRRNSPRTRKPSANLYSARQRDLLQHLVDAAEQPLVVEPLVAHAPAPTASVT